MHVINTQDDVGQSYLTIDYLTQRNQVLFCFVFLPHRKGRNTTLKESQFGLRESLQHPYIQLL